MKAVYDLEYWQPTYTMAVFLIAAEHERLKRNEQYIDVGIMPGSGPGSFGSYKHWPNTLDQCRGMLIHVVKPMLGMLPSVRKVGFLKERSELEPGTFALGRKYTGNLYFSAYAAGVRAFRIKETGFRDPKLITITLRECGEGHWGARDSNVEEWHAAGVLLQKLGYRIVVVRDTRLAKAPLGFLAIAPDASLDLQKRAELYRMAALNLFVSNGPAWFSLALDVPMLMFRPTCEKANKSSKAESMASEGILPGRQLAGSPPYQRLVWEDDKAEIIVREVQRFFACSK